MRNLMTAVLMLGVGLVAITGCEQKKMSMEEMMQAPPRPAELDHLNAFVGTWRGEGDGVMTGADETMASEGETVSEWSMGNRFLIGHDRWTMGGTEMEGIGIWTWDNKSGVYRTWWFDSYGSVSQGTASYDADEGIWRMKGKGRSMVDGSKSVGEGTMKFVDEDTMEWTFSEWDSLHMVKFMEFNGTSRRQ